MVRLGLLVNPDAGLGGRLGLKGSDGQAEYARSQGAEDRSGPRVKDALEYFSNLHRDKSEIKWFTSQGRMGTNWISEDIEIGEIITIHQSLGSTKASDTSDLVISLLESDIDLLLYAGGDGTTRDIISVLDAEKKSEIPVIGIPCGVKMHSGCFASSPKAGAEVLSAWLNDDLLISSTEVLDLDEDKYRDGEWAVRLYAEAKTPASPRWMQGAKMRVEVTGEEEIIEGLSDHIKQILISDSNVTVVLVNIFGGIMRCDIIADGIISAVKEVGIKIPIVVRLEGTNVELGKETLNNSKLNIISADSLTDAANKAVEIANGK